MNSSLHERLTVGSDELTFRVTSDDSGGALLAFEVRMPSGGGPPTLHRHAPAELYRVDRGEFTFYLGDEDGGVTRITAAAGEVVPIAPGREHTVRNESDDEARAFVVIAPGDEFERFVRSAAAGADAAALAGAHGIEFTRPVAALR